ncbi:hypothetical protein M0802_009980 [Mischocyttarus mexicanus]|nr:hypothetical protein M0802_009980 [Mischocyttarus mexicanus]
MTIGPFGFNFWTNKRTVRTEKMTDDVFATTSKETGRKLVKSMHIASAIVGRHEVTLHDVTSANQSLKKSCLNICTIAVRIFSNNFESIPASGFIHVGLVSVPGRGNVGKRKRSDLESRVRKKERKLTVGDGGDGDGGDGDGGGGGGGGGCGVRNREIS